MKWNSNSDGFEKEKKNTIFEHWWNEKSFYMENKSIFELSDGLIAEHRISEV